jgi:predicted amidohydrolase
VALDRGPRFSAVAIAGRQRETIDRTCAGTTFDTVTGSMLARCIRCRIHAYCFVHVDSATPIELLLCLATTRSRNRTGGISSCRQSTTSVKRSDRDTHFLLPGCLCVVNLPRMNHFMKPRAHLARTPTPDMAQLLAVLLVVATCGSFVRGDYVAAVVQHAVPSPSSSPFFTKVSNLHVYSADAAMAAQSGAQIIVFPEFGLTANEDLASRTTTVEYAEYVPDLNSSTLNPCEDPVGFEDSPALYYGSCMARNNSIVVLINLFEQRMCNHSEFVVSDASSCPKDGQFIYNTDVIFNERGEFVAKYRKTHPFYIFSVDPAPVDQPLVTYKASFGVKSVQTETLASSGSRDHAYKFLFLLFRTYFAHSIVASLCCSSFSFGLFICFDIAFPHPALDLVAAGVTNFLYAAAIGEIGKATVAKLWSWSNKANVMLANHGNTSSDIIIQGETRSMRCMSCTVEVDWSRLSR